MDLSPGYLFASLFVSAIGGGLFLYGKKQERIPQLAAGVVMSIYPFFVPGVTLMIVVGVAIIVVLTMMVRAGY